MKTILRQKNKGFTIIETLVAISLLLLAITGPMVFAQTGLRAAFQSRDQITAFYLAHDAIEFIKNRRDHLILEKDSESWLDAFVGCESESNSREGGCTLDTTTAMGEVAECNFSGTLAIGCLGENPNGQEDSHLKINANDGGVIGFDGSVNSIFSRTVYVDEGADPQEARVTVIVRWRSHENLGVREIQVVEYARNWAKALKI